MSGAMPSAMSHGKRVAALVATVAALACAVLLSPIERWAPALVETIRAAGAFGAIGFALLYVAAVVLLMPSSVLNGVAGFVYGPVLGFALAWPVGAIAGTVAFLLGRTALRGWVLSTRVARSARFQALDTRMGEHGFKIVALLRLSPVAPFCVLNYVLGASRVRAKDFALSAFASIPGTFLYVYLGSLVPTAADVLAGKRPDAGPFAHVLSLAGLLATALVSALLAQAARRSLDRELTSS
jgi:uncharacterized membrane protein YdjX (TVP38/TMEM64 family)